MSSDIVSDAFLSYASDDAPLAEAFLAALERTGLKCWIAPRDVPPGTLYADAIVRAINGARLFVLILSKHSVDSPHVSKELERASSKRRPMIVVRADAAPLSPAYEYFLSESQWIDMGPQGQEGAASKLADAARRLLDQGPSAAHPTLAAAPTPRPAGTTRLSRPVAALLLVVLAGIGYLLADKFWLSKRGPAAADSTAATATPAATGAPATAPPPHSIAVLPFVNMSGDPAQEYFSDGLSEELLNSLVTVRDLQVAARTSSFSFKGKNESVADIASKLNVGAVLEGSVRKAGDKVRITAQLINASTGYHLWSHTYDRDLKNVLALQAEIANEVTKALQARLMGETATVAEVGGTQVPAAFDAYLKGKNLTRGELDRQNVLAIVAAFADAARLDPKFAKAYAEEANFQTIYASNFAKDTEVRPTFREARDNVGKALALAPDLGEAHAVLAVVLERGSLDFARAQSEYERALALSPSDVEVLLRSGATDVVIGRTDTGLAKIRKAISLDPLNHAGYMRLSYALSSARRHREAIEAANRALQVTPGDTPLLNSRGLDELALGDFAGAQKDCGTPKRYWVGQLCLAILFDRQHRRADAEAELGAMKESLGDSAAYQYAEIYTQWGDHPKALDWLETAYRLPDPGIVNLKTDELIDPLRGEPRFKSIEAKLAFPD